ncbi:TetR/AcrR family transcriptional regulator [Gordonia sp. SL306]|uniref:TetR/AcrR family transcriptional regulator n=1 Tax=Gordonia sp. SL306 TaxID=2995145 RepID=UPI002270A348|nr:TetR/AcrR family transcriptional regulator [Gordonia sp. SL306]WAC54182.1 TetR/AcrR family transcriptional regulator [Gordonia sp. SL306]
MSMQTEVRSAKERLILTAERLYALHGLDGVPLRQIAIEAGTANKSAVQYHFGSKDALVTAVLANRVDDLDRRRGLLYARADLRDVRAVVEAQHLPLIELGEDQMCYYLEFIEQLERKSHPFHELPPANRLTEQAYYDRVGALLGSVPVELRELRIKQATAACLHICTDRRRTRELGEAVPPYAVHVSQLLDSLVGLLTLEPSRETTAALEVWSGQKVGRT